MVTDAATASTPAPLEAGRRAVQMKPAGRARAALLAIALLPLGWFALSSALAMSLEGRAPQVLARVIPGAPAGLVARAQILLLSKGSANYPEARALLRRSLARRPLDPAALRLYGLTYGGIEELAKGKLGASRRGEPFFRLADRVSRRDVATELYLVLADGEKNDIGAALKRIDRTLRASNGGRDQLFPVVAQIIARPDGRELFARMVRPQSGWLADFLSFAIDSGTDPEAVALAAASVGGYPDAAGRMVFEQSLVRALDSRADYRAMAQLLPRLHSLPPAIISGVGLDANRIDSDWAPLDWQTSESAAISAYPLTAADGSSALSVSMGGGVRGRVARKLVKLAPGKYRLTIGQEFDGQTDSGLSAAAAIPEWTVSCLDRDPPEVLLALSGQHKTLQGDFVVGAKCPLAMVALYAKSPESAATATMTVKDIALSRLVR